MRSRSARTGVCPAFRRLLPASRIARGTGTLRAHMGRAGARQLLPRRPRRGQGLRDLPRHCATVQAMPQVPHVDKGQGGKYAMPW